FVELIKPPTGRWSLELELRGFCEIRDEAGEPEPNIRFFASRCKLFERVLSDCLQHAVAWLVSGRLVWLDEALIQQRRQTIHHVAGDRGDCLRRLQSPAARKNRQLAKQGLVLVLEQAV